MKEGTFIYPQLRDEYLEYYIELINSGETVEEATKTALAMLQQSIAMKRDSRRLSVMNEGPNRDQAFNLRELMKVHNAANR